MTNETSDTSDTSVTTNDDGSADSGPSLREPDMNHENTRIYQRSLELNSRCARLIEELPVGFGFLADEVRRASSSVLLNFAEGCGRTGSKERRRFFVIAAGSAQEVSAATDVAHAHGVIEDAEHAELKEVCAHVVAMLGLYR